MIRLLLVCSVSVIVLTSSAIAAKYDEFRIPCNSTELGSLHNAVANADQLSKAASKALPPNNSTRGARFRRWFGGGDGSYDPVVKQVFDEMAVTLVFQKFWCLPPNSNTPDDLFHTNAFIIKGSVGEIFVTSNFFLLPQTGTGSQGGTIVHEASHQSNKRAIGDDDKHYGPKAAQSRALASASRARATADNFKYFAEDIVYRGAPIARRA